MTLIYNTFQSPASGTTLTTGNTSNADGSTAFSAISIGTGTTVATDTAHFVFGSQALKVASAATSAACYAEWLSVGPLNTSATSLWGVHYLYLTALPSATYRLAQALGSSSGFNSALAVNTSGKLLGQDTTNTTQTPAFTNAVPLNQWFRVEWFTLIGATTGQVEVKLFSNATSTVATETQTSLATINTGTGVMGQTRVGNTSASANFGPFWFGYTAFSDTGYIGPSNLAYPLPRIEQLATHVSPVRSASF